MRRYAVLALSVTLAACAQRAPTTASGAPAAAAPPAAAMAASAPAGVAVQSGLPPAGAPIPPSMIPIGSPKFGATTDCNALSGGTVQGRTSATSMLDCTTPTAYVAAPAAPPTPAPAPAAANFATCFANDSAQLTPEAGQVIQQAIANARAVGASKLVVVGHADTTGPSELNEKLSQARADAVKQALLAAGVPDAAVETHGMGESQLIVPTPDETPESRNRCAIIHPVSAQGT